jgi:hypothetical protein
VGKQLLFSQGEAITRLDFLNVDFQKGRNYSHIAGRNIVIENLQKIHLLSFNGL